METDYNYQTEETEPMLQEMNMQDSAINNRYIPQPRLGTSFHSLKIINSQNDSCITSGVKKCIFMFFCLTSFIFFGLIIFAYYCAGIDSLCSLPSHKYNKMLKFITSNVIGKTSRTKNEFDNMLSFEDVIDKDFQFDIKGHDVIVFLHMQKTGGTIFGKHLVKNLELMRDCVCHRRIKKRCSCLRPGPHSKETWLFSRYSTGWKCGLHADWTELTGCVDDVLDRIDQHSIERRYFYITLLRDPIHRFLSEFRHVRRGATWKNSILYCNGRPATKEEVPLCYEGDDWADVTLEDFVSCKSNLAINRQTRMLADLSLVNCYNKTAMSEREREVILLKSAKQNLHRMAFFGLTEYQEISQYIFEETFNMKFNVRFEQFNFTRADDAMEEVDPILMKKVKELNNLDVQLYEYAKNVLNRRFKKLKNLDPHFKEHYSLMGYPDI